MNGGINPNYKLRESGLGKQGQVIVQAPGWFCRTAAVSNQAAKHINKEIGDTAMTRVLDLGNVLELINDGFNDIAELN